MRKSVSYLTSIRHEVTDTAARAEIIATDLENLLLDMASKTPEQIRTDDDYFDTIKQAQQLHGDLGRQLKAHDKAVRDLKTFF